MLRRSFHLGLAAAVVLSTLTIALQASQARAACPRCQGRAACRNCGTGCGACLPGCMGPGCRGNLYVRAAARNDLFSNYYVGGSYCGDVPAQLYLSPRPTPPLVGHTYITYQPLMPHEFLYPHSRHYYRYDSPWCLFPSNCTTVRWW